MSEPTEQDWQRAREFFSIIARAAEMVRITGGASQQEFAVDVIAQEFTRIRQETRAELLDCRGVVKMHEETITRLSDERGQMEAERDRLLMRVKLSEAMLTTQESLTEALRARVAELEVQFEEEVHKEN